MREGKNTKALGALITADADSMTSVVQACMLHSGEGWTWTKELIDTFPGWESQNLEILGARNWKSKGISSKLFRTSQIRMARKRFAKDGGEGIQYLLVLRI